MLTACPGCGVGVDPDFVQPTPHKVCPICKHPLTAEAVESMTHHAANAADPKDGLRTTLREQALADVAGFEGRHEEARATAEAMRATAARVDELHARVATTEAMVTAARPATPGA